jgi:hypothetical protein
VQKYEIAREFFVILSGVKCSLRELFAQSKDPCRENGPYLDGAFWMRQRKPSVPRPEIVPLLGSFDSASPLANALRCYAQDDMLQLSCPPVGLPACLQSFILLIRF